MKHFGTDGIRGIANIELSAILACRTGLSTAIVLSLPPSASLTPPSWREANIVEVL